MKFDPLEIKFEFPAQRWAGDGTAVSDWSIFFNFFFAKKNFETTLETLAILIFEDFEPLPQKPKKN